MRPLHADSQCSHILGWLSHGKPITPALAYDRWGCLRLSERIRELKSRGHRIVSNMIWCGKSRVAEYRLAKGAK